MAIYCIKFFLTKSVNTRVKFLFYENLFSFIYLAENVAMLLKILNYAGKMLQRQ